MKKYLIHADNTIHKFDYELGELDFINEYQIKEFIDAETPKDAISRFVKNGLCYSFDIDEMETDEFGNFYFDILTDENNYQASIEDLELWKKGEYTLFNDYVRLKIYELSQIFINELETV